MELDAVHGRFIDFQALILGLKEAARGHRSAEDGGPAAREVPTSVLHLVGFDFADALFEGEADAAVGGGVAHLAIEFGEEHGGKKGVDVGAECTLDLGALEVGDGEAFGG